MGEVIPFTTCRICIHFRKVLKDMPDYRCADCDVKAFQQLEIWSELDHISYGQEVKVIMSKFLKLVVVLGFVLTALWGIYYLVGPTLSETAFHIPRLGWGVTWTMLVGGCLGYLGWRIVKGK